MQDTAVKRILLVFPTHWDRRQLNACSSQWDQEYEVVFAEPEDDNCHWDLNVPSWVDQTVERFRSDIDGVFSSSDYPGATAAGAIATDLGLHGTPPENILRTTHKYYSRLAQQSTVPEAVPEFSLIDPKNPDEVPSIGFPCFIKPVRAAFSLFSRRIEDRNAYRSFLARPEIQEFLEHYVQMFDGLREARSDLEISGRHFIAETPLAGFQVTVEGFRQRGRTTILGVVDSVTYPDTHSFARFDYPSFLGPAVQERMASITDRVAVALGLESTIFNVEMFYDPGRDRIWIIEVNPRLCGQFGDLYQKVDGVNSYRIALDLAAGRVPEMPHRQGDWICASSYPLRVFEPCRSLSSPTEGRIQQIEREFPGTLVWTEYAEGAEIADFASEEDGFSARYGIVNLGANNREDLARRFEGVVSALEFRFEAI